MLLLDLAAAATWFAGRYGPERPEGLRLFLLWAMPGLIYLCGLLTREKRNRPGGRGAPPALLRLPGIPLPALPPVKPVLPLPAVPVAATGGGPAAHATPVVATRWTKLGFWIALAIAIDLAPFPIADRLGWLTFAFGEPQPLARHALTALWALPLLVMVAIRFSERTLRGQLFRGLGESWGASGAWALTLLCGTALALPAVAPGFAFGAPVAVAAGLATALGREIGATVLFRASGLAAAGLFRGTLVFLDFFLVADWLQPVLPSAAFSSSAGTFHLLRAASPLVAALLLARALPARDGRATPPAAGAGKE